MKNTLGKNVTLTLFGESHGAAVGAVLDGIAPGIEVDEDFIKAQLSLRRPADNTSTARREPDNFTILSGVFEGKTTGTPICIIIPNENTKSKDYSATRALARPGHADYAAFCKYHGFEDYRGGGHFSGRVSAAIVALGAIAIDALRKKGILIGTHIKKCGGISDADFSLDIDKLREEILSFGDKQFALVDTSVEGAMREKIESARLAGDSVGGVLQTAVLGLPAGVGEPYFDSVESKLAHALFSVGGVKGVEFGGGFAMSDMLGSEANDAFLMSTDRVVTATNNNGGINGGISNGMPILFCCAVKPTPSIYKKQETVDFINLENKDIEIQGRHDPCIVHRARVVVDSITAIVLCDILAERYGTDWLFE